MRHDYTHYLEHTLQKTEDDWLANPELHFAQGKAVKAFLFDHPNVKTMVEVGCATGNLARLVPAGIGYTGYDASENALKMARAKNPGKMFKQADIRQLSVEPREKKDLVVCFATMKHFAIEEWADVLARVLGLGRRGLFDVPIREFATDDGVEFPHVWLTEKIIREAVERACHSIVSIDKTGIEWMFETVEREEAC